MKSLSQSKLAICSAMLSMCLSAACGSSADDGLNGATEDAVSAVGNKLGAWLFIIDETGMSWEGLADELKSQGVGRIFIKVADGSRTCGEPGGGLFPETCNTTVPEIFKSRGIEPWAWTYNYPSDYDRQADALYYAAQHGYVGFVLDIEVEFDGTSTELHNLMSAFDRAKADAMRDGHANDTFLVGATTWGNPKDHSMRVDIIDQYVDFHMPQTYLEVWGQTYMNDPAGTIELGNCEYRELGANKPIWHIVSAEHGVITGATLDEFFRWAGPNASLWRIPGGAVSQSIWNDWDRVDWNRSSFAETACSAGNYDIPNQEPPRADRAYCPPGTEFDSSLGFCSDGIDVWGPFPQAMTQACVDANAGEAC
ncbi:MAG: hypothetical protein AAGC55_32615, partial [Myxococcota bacterium]